MFIFYFTFPNEIYVKLFNICCICLGSKKWILYLFAVLSWKQQTCNHNNPLPKLSLFSAVLSLAQLQTVERKNSSSEVRERNLPVLPAGI